VSVKLWGVEMAWGQFLSCFKRKPVLTSWKW